MHYCPLESVETSNPGGIKITSSHFDVEFSCKIILLLVYIFKILHRKIIDIEGTETLPTKKREQQHSG